MEATILSGVVTGGSAGGVFQEIFDPIGNVGSDNHQSNSVFGFNEEQNVFLDSNLAVDILGVGGAGTVAAGQTIASRLFLYFIALHRSLGRGA